MGNSTRKEIYIMIVTKDSIIGDVLDEAPDTAPFFFEIGMHCLGCPASRGESIADACDVHGTDADELIKKINDYLAKKEACRPPTNAPTQKRWGNLFFVEGYSSK
jgi:hybrid cluster-associated redox disulfide protein